MNRLTVSMHCPPKFVIYVDKIIDVRSQIFKYFFRTTNVVKFLSKCYLQARIFIIAIHVRIKIELVA